MDFGNLLGSLRAVNNESAVINSNLVGSVRNGYKASNHSYGGGGAQDLGNNLQIPDQSLVTSNTSIDFGQGQVVSTGQQTDLAINGEGFFLLQQLQDVGVSSPNLISRDGQFKFTNAGALGTILTTSNGLAVLRDNGAGAYTTISQADFQNNNVRPTIVKPDGSLESLKFSNKGATVFEFDGTFSQADGVLVEGSIEASNSNLQESVAALAVNSKKFQAMASQIKVENNNLDVLLGLVK